MKVVILAGGKATRMGDIELPKSLVSIGGKPIIWHIMKTYSHYGFKDFIVCLGHKGDLIKEYFDMNREPGWNVACVETGIETTKSERLKKIKQLINEENFLVSYGDDICDVNIKKVIDYHKSHGNIATITAVKLESPFGILEMNKENKIMKFQEKPILEHYINGGFMVFSKGIFDYLDEGELEKEVFDKLVKDGKIHAFKHDGFWRCMNTTKETLELGDLWRNGKAKWRVWKD